MPDGKLLFFNDNLYSKNHNITSRTQDLIYSNNNMGKQVVTIPLQNSLHDNNWIYLRQIGAGSADRAIVQFYIGNEYSYTNHSSYSWSSNSIIIFTIVDNKIYQLDMGVWHYEYNITNPAIIKIDTQLSSNNAIYRIDVWIA